MLLIFHQMSNFVDRGPGPLEKGKEIGKSKFIVSEDFVSYDCNSGFCTTPYGSTIYGTSDDVAEACSQDYPNCRAYWYSKKEGRGHMCSTANNANYTHLDSILCSQTLGKNFDLIYFHY